MFYYRREALQWIDCRIILNQNFVLQWIKTLKWRLIAKYF